jgi:flagellar basal-body rod modification protein FlgD
MSVPITTITGAAATASSTTSGTTGSTGSSGLNQVLNEQDFFQLLAAELQNQDPTQPVSPTQMMTQLAEFGQLDALTQIQTSTAQEAQAAAPILNGAALIGRTVTTATGSGAVTSASVQNGTVSVQVQRLGTVALSDVLNVTG